MRKIGYARVSSTHQNLDRQLGAFRAERVDVVFREKASGKSTKGRPELEKAIDERRTRRWEPQKCGLDSHRPIQVSSCPSGSRASGVATSSLQIA
jgi:hypothetical protein